MTDREMILLHKSSSDPAHVRVIANDYSYDGWLVSIFFKCKGALRCVVEDDNGRLFIHNAGQLVNPDSTTNHFVSVTN